MEKKTHILCLFHRSYILVCCNFGEVLYDTIGCISTRIRSVTASYVLFNGQEMIDMTPSQR